MHRPACLKQAWIGDQAHRACSNVRDVDNGSLGKGLCKPLHEELAELREFVWLDTP